ncbi:hypothetical protein [Legionella longbeachae]|uniref:hypothetical protein n=1 Tax=Legionella longbeachae TaxID=450 RepID=UPI000A1C0D9A|nr:hypothetical protein [Legionella longbeachae]ARM34944.1 hypothetical protein B0B39_16115 [Legionella longbeachae]QEY50893.1 hypothetical protein FQU71_06290 [Legionella longbeachae]
MKTKLIYVISSIAISCPVYSKIPSFVGDLVARDLVGAGPLGHVGIASAPDYRMRPTVVLEALDSVPHIQVNSIDNFKSRSKFWGSKGGLLPPKSNESYTVANRIVRQYYACPEYTITWRWREGKIDSNTKPISCGQFRCDTLVNYAYAFSAGYSLPTYDTTWTTPLAVYNYFPVDSDLLIPEHLNSASDSVLANINANISSINENNLIELNAENFYQMLQNSSNISKEEIKYLWKLLTSNQVDSKVKILFYDFISFETPDYLTDEIIKQAKNETGESRHKLLVTLQSIYQKSLGKNEETSLKEISNFFKELQLEDLDKNDGGIVYRGLATLAPKHISTKKANLTNMDKIHVDILSLKSDRNNEKKYVQDIIHNLDNPDDSLVVTASYQYFTQLLINSDLSFFSQESKQLFKKHLENKNMINHNQSMLYTSAYLEFKAALNASKAEEIPTLANDYVQLLNPEIQESTFNGFTDFTKGIKHING